LLAACGGDSAMAIFRFIRADYHAENPMSLYVSFHYH